MTPNDASVVFNIGGLPVTLILPKRDIELVALSHMTNRILERGRDEGAGS